MSEQEQRDQVPPTVPLEHSPSPVDTVGSSVDRSQSPEIDVAPAPRRRRRINLDGIVWAAILIWAGLVLLADSFGYLSALGIRGFDLSWDMPFRPAVWTLVFLGGAILIGLDIVIRLAVPKYRRNVLGYVILAIVSLSLGLGRLALMWPLILVALGVALLLKRYRS
ncbi:MAG: hypothetical protein JXC32_11015 [Anaerolineae bacterium]|nr:hypothetical protein [Anaerolineae bacterium]